MQVGRVRTPWWHWVLFSFSVSLVTVLFMLASIIWLAFQGIDVLDYFMLPRPPFITDGRVAAAFGLLISAQTGAAAVLIPLFRPVRQEVVERLRILAVPGGFVTRLGPALLAAFAVQAGWAVVKPAPPGADGGVVDHLIYAAVGGGQFWPLFWIGLTVAVVVPVTEEILFRGVLFGMIRRRFGFLIGALASATVFGIAHGWPAGIPTGLLGLVLAWQTERDQSLLGAMLLHILNNATAVAVALAKVH